jgi:hypothetical protein
MEAKGCDPRENKITGLDILNFKAFLNPAPVFIFSLSGDKKNLVHAKAPRAQR